MSTCHLCGAPGRELLPRVVLCPRCEINYSVYSCPSCGVSITKLRELGQGPCDTCALKPRLRDLSKKTLGELDADILGRHILAGSDRLQKTMNLSPHESLRVFQFRYKELRQLRPNDFPCDDEEYWRGVYT